MPQTFVMPPLPPVDRYSGYSIFRGYDSGPDETPYCCSFHWFRLPDDRILGLDVVRSGDSGRQALRVFLVEHSGEVTGFIAEGANDTFAPFATDAPPALDGTRVLGRGEGWIAGKVDAPGQPFDEVRFSLEVSPLCRAHSTKELFDLDLTYLSAIDYTIVHTRGYVQLGTTRYEVDAKGPVSVHVGAHLPPYGYAAKVPTLRDDDDTALLVASVSGEDVRFLGHDLREAVFTYGLGVGKVPKHLYSLNSYARLRLPVGLVGRIDLSSVQIFPHTLLGETTIMASADAVLHRAFRLPVDLGRVVIDVRGRPFSVLVAAGEGWDAPDDAGNAPDPSTDALGVDPAAQR